MYPSKIIIIWYVKYCLSSKSEYVLKVKSVSGFFSRLMVLRSTCCLTGQEGSLEMTEGVKVFLWLDVGPCEGCVGCAYEPRE